MEKPSFDPMTLLSLLEASQSAVESSDQALRAAEAALSAAQAANKQAKNALKNVTEVFVQENRNLKRLSRSEKQSGTRIRPSYSSMDCESDIDSDDDFMMLSTNKNPVNDIEDDSSEDGDSFNDPNFIMISSTGPAADNHADMMGVYRRSDEMRDGRSVYIQEQDDKYEDSPCELVSVKGGWLVKWLGNLYMFVPTVSYAQQESHISQVAVLPMGW